MMLPLSASQSSQSASRTAINSPLGKIRGPGNKGACCKNSVSFHIVQFFEFNHLGFCEISGTPTLSFSGSLNGVRNFPFSGERQGSVTCLLDSLIESDSLTFCQASPSRYFSSIRSLRFFGASTRAFGIQESTPRRSSFLRRCLSTCGKFLSIQRLDRTRRPARRTAVFRTHVMPGPQIAKGGFFIT